MYQYEEWWAHQELQLFERLVVAVERLAGAAENLSSNVCGIDNRIETLAVVLSEEVKRGKTP